MKNQEGTLVKFAVVLFFYLFGIVPTFAQADICVSEEIDLTITIDSMRCNKFEGEILVESDQMIDEFFWFGPNSQFGFNLDIIAEFPGNYILIATDSSGCESRDTVLMEYAKPAPQISLNYPTISCQESEVVLEVDPLNSNFEYEWEQKNNPNFSAPNSPTINVNEGGIYFVTITRPSDNCIIRNWSLVITDTIPILVTITPDIIDCNPLVVELENNLDLFVFQSYQWVGPDITNINNDELTPLIALPGTYTITGIGENGCEFSSSINVEDNSESLITSYLDMDGDGYGDSLASIEDCEIPAGYTQEAGDCDDQNAAINPDALDLDANGIDENCDGVDGPSSTSRIQVLDVKVYPNPFFENLFIESDNENLAIAIFDMQGRQVRHDLQDSRVVLNDIVPGSYILKIQDLKTGFSKVEHIVKLR